MENEKAIAKKKEKIGKLLEKAKTGDTKSINKSFIGLTKLIGDASQHVRIASLNALVQIYGTNVVPTLIPSLYDPHEAVRKATTDILGGLRDVRAVAPISQLLGDPSEEVRVAAIDALICIGGVASVNALIGVLSNADGVIVRKAIGALVKIGHASATAPLIGLLKTSYKYEATEALINIGDASAANAFVVALADEDELMREKAAQALGVIKSEQAVERLIDIFKDKNEKPSVRNAAAQTLGEYQDSRILETLICIFKDENDNLSVRITAAQTLGEYQDQRAVEPLIWGLYTTPVVPYTMFTSEPYSLSRYRFEARKLKCSFRKSIIKSLGQIGDRRAISPLIESFNDIYAWEALIEALDKLGDPLGKALIGYGWDEQFEAIYEMDDPRAVALLIQSLDNEEPMLSYGRMEALCRIGDIRAVESLIGAMCSFDGVTRENAAEVLEKLGEPKWMEINDCDDAEQMKKLGKSGDVRLVKPLIRVIEDQYMDDDFVKGAVVALGDIGDRRAVEPLIKAIYHPRLSVGFEVIKSLGKLKDPRAIAPLKAVIDDEEDEDLYIYAKRAIVEIEKAKSNNQT